MTVKTAVSLTDRHHSFAKAKVEEGQFASVSSVIAAGLEQIIRDEEEREAALDAMRETIKKRMALPKQDWIPLDGDDAFDQVREQLSAE